jgi:hypothetical protein
MMKIDDGVKRIAKQICSRFDNLKEKKKMKIVKIVKQAIESK